MQSACSPLRSVAGGHISVGGLRSLRSLRAPPTRSARQCGPQTACRPSRQAGGSLGFGALMDLMDEWVDTVDGQLPPPTGPALAPPGSAPEAAPVRPPRRRRDWRFWVGGLGRVLIALGVLLLGFVAYQLWGTAIQHDRAQNDLEKEFAAQLGTTTVPAPTTTAAPTTAPVSTVT